MRIIYGWKLALRPNHDAFKSIPCILSMSNTTILSKWGYDPDKSAKALDVLLVNRHQEFRALAQVIFARLPPGFGPVNDWEVFVLNFTLDVTEQFKVWCNETPVNAHSAIKALTILRQVGSPRTTMNHITHMLNISYMIAEEFKVIYRRTDLN